MSDLSAAGVVRLAEIRDGALSVDEVLAALDAPDSGAVALFVGRVRDHDEGETVQWLSYSAHPSAGQVLAEVCQRVAQTHPVRALAAVHRVGDLVVGDIAVIAAVATGHRGLAFEVCEELINVVKAEVPIWKHQGLLDGREVWVGAHG